MVGMGARGYPKNVQRKQSLNFDQQRVSAMITHNLADQMHKWGFYCKEDRVMKILALNIDTFNHPKKIWLNFSFSRGLFLPFTSCELTQCLIFCCLYTSLSYVYFLVSAWRVLSSRMPFYNKTTKKRCK